MSLTKKVYHQKFQIETQDPNAWPRVMAQKLKNLYIHWLNPDTQCAVEIVELVIIKQFCAILPVEACRWVYCHQLTSLEEATWKAEGFIEAELDCLDPLKASRSQG